MVIKVARNTKAARCQDYQHSYLYQATADPEIASDPNIDACPDRDVVGHGLSR